MLLEVVVLADEVLEDDAFDGTKELDGALAFLVQQARSVEIPDFEAGGAESATEINLLTVEKELFVEATNGGEDRGGHKHAGAENSFDLAGGAMVPVGEVGLGGEGATWELEGQGTVLKELVEQRRERSATVELHVTGGAFEHRADSAGAGMKFGERKELVENVVEEARIGVKEEEVPPVAAWAPRLQPAPKPLLAWL